MSNFKFIFLLLVAGQLQSQTINITGPAGSGQFGKTVTVLTNGNYVVTDPSYDDGAIANVGAVYLYNGVMHTVISTIIGSKASDSVGSNGVTTLSNGNYVVNSRYWDNGAAINAGAVTWGNGTIGVTGIVGSSNSLVGSKTSDAVGNSIVKLSNGNYAAIFPNWDNGAAIDAGAVTWGNGSTGISGVISSSNSLVGSTASDGIGISVITLTGGNYLVSNPSWDNGAAVNAGAVTWGNISTGISGIINSNNSLVGTKTNDRIGNTGVTVLSNGNYVVNSPNWSNGLLTNAGAATWGNGLSGISGEINISNSLVGIKVDDQISYIGTTALANGNYVVSSINWDNGSITDAGAATWANGKTGLTGAISANNSIVGGSSGDHVGSTITALSNGNYVIGTHSWHNGSIAFAGATTWADGITGGFGLVTASNSLVGNKVNDNVGNGIIALTNGNYVVQSPSWDNGTITEAGAVTIGNGIAGTMGIVSSINSLVGSTANDRVGIRITALTNGNYVVQSSSWDNGTIVDAGSVTWSNGITGSTGQVTSNNSLVGSTAYDQIGANDMGRDGITTLSNGNYLVRSEFWSNGVVGRAGAVTWCNGVTGTSGAVSTSNSLVGNKSLDLFQMDNVKLDFALDNGNYVVASPLWDNGTATNAGAVTWANGNIGVSGLISSNNSLVGILASDRVGYNAPNNGITIQSNSNYVVRSMFFNNGAAVQQGAVTWGNGSTGIIGIITNCNSVTETGPYLPSDPITPISSPYNAIYDYLLVGRPISNIVSIYSPTGMGLSSTLDSLSVNINGANAIPLIANTGCRIIATLTPNGASPVSSALRAKVWVEPSVPTYGGDPFVARHYEITPLTNASTATAKVTLYFTQQEFDDFNNHTGSILNLPTNDADETGIANLRIGKYSGTSNDGSGLPPAYSGSPVIIDPNDADIIWNGSLNRWEVSFDVTGFSGFVVQTKTTALPLQLLSFSATLAQNDVLVSWKTTNEINTKNFEVERSTDGRNFTKVGTVAAFNSSTEHVYNYIDAGAALLNYSKLYYRLKQIDIDGSYINSSIVLLHLSRNNSITVYPNPVSNITTLSFSNKALLNTLAVLTDMQGKSIKQFFIRNYQELIDMNHLPNGMYLLKLEDGTAIKLVKN